jgi:uncharacterized protein YecE (DUF72 family)
VAIVPHRAGARRPGSHAPPVGITEIMILVGTSGWQYRHWRTRFYPVGLPQNRWLEHYAQRFATVELNSAFYRLPTRAAFDGWRDRTPDGFCMAVKMSRYLTHIRRLRDPAEPVARFLERADALGDRFGPVLLQLPPDFAADHAALAAVLARFPEGRRVAVEPRHPSWWTAEVRQTLADHQAALCWADRREDPLTPLWRTAGFGYLRLHEGLAKPSPRYRSATLRRWADRLAEAYGPDETVFVYFNNDPNGAALIDAEAFADQCRDRGLPVTRTKVTS